MGNTEVNTDCKPVSSRSLGSKSICRKRWYDFFCTSIRLGIWTVVLIFAKSRRSRSRVARLPLRLLMGEYPLQTKPDTTTRIDPRPVGPGRTIFEVPVPRSARVADSFAADRAG